MILHKKSVAFQVLPDTKMAAALLEQVEAMSAANLDATDTSDASAITASAPAAVSLTRNASLTSNVDESEMFKKNSPTICFVTWPINLIENGCKN